VIYNITVYKVEFVTVIISLSVYNQGNP